MTTLGATTSSTNIDPWRRRADFLAALGFISFPEDASCQAQTVVTSQWWHGYAHYLYAGEQITNVVAPVTTAAAGTVPTLIKLGIVSDASGTPTCRAATADVASDAKWTSTGMKEFPISGGAYTVPTSGIYYACFLQNGAFASTPLQLAVGVNLSGLADALGSHPMRQPRFATGKTTLAVNDTGTYTAIGTAPMLLFS